MKTLPLSTLFLALVAIAVVAAQGPTPMKPGRWEVSTQMQMANMPMQMKPTTTTSCVTAAQLAVDPTGGMSTGPQGGACKATDVKVVDNTVTWKMACAGATAMTGDGELTFVGDTYSGSIKSKMAQGEMTIQLAGKRLGECTAADLKKDAQR
jgi:hypothetical protein